MSAALQTNTRPADPTNATAAAVADRRARQRRWVALGLLVSAQFVVMLDTSIVNVALPSVQSALGLSPTAITWVVNAYVLASAACCSCPGVPLTCSDGAACSSSALGSSPLAPCWPGSLPTKDS